MEEDITRAVKRISGRWGKECYFDLCCVVETAMAYMPGTFDMNVLCKKAERLCEKGEKSIAQAVTRATKDSWENGDREKLHQLFQHVLREKPSPKDLVTALAQSVWDQRRNQPKACYRVTESQNPVRYGYMGYTQNPRTQFALAPFCAERERVEKLVERLNREQVPLKQVVESALNGDPLLEGLLCLPRASGGFSGKSR